MDAMAPSSLERPRHVKRSCYLIRLGIGLAEKFCLASRVRLGWRETQRDGEWLCWLNDGWTECRGVCISEEGGHCGLSC